MNYIDKIKEKLNEILRFDEEYNELLGLYALLVLVVGAECTNEHVHDAWSVWQTDIDNSHRSLIPFKDLSKKVQDLDIEYRDAIIKVSLDIKG